MQASLVELMEELLQAMEQRDAGDPDAPAWEACDRIRRLEAELATRLGEADARRLTAGPTGPQTRRVEEALAGIA